MWSAHETRSINSAVAQQRSFSSKSPLEKLLERRVHNRTPHCRTANDSATNPAAPRTELLCAPRPNPRELTRNGTVYLVVFGSFLLIGPNENPCRVDFLTREGIVQLPLSDFLESSLLRRWQSFADARAHAVTKARNSTAGRTDRLGMTGHSGESFAEILHQLDPSGGSGKFAAQSLKKGRRQRRSRSSLAGSHLPGGPIE